ncbi:hypothetical protein [Pseudonocardia humida]|uniref:DUF2786 domain-containing protein n=1 Tax=Pseudonocardia humida TaxID=2800819 RepID=A0ABT0ZUC4_9PSEU|nr:hypothetical protein [Pseudonocardia humida]MCO1654330.1 hypothetical protein [Pseudonocardia humida]
MRHDPARFRPRDLRAFEDGRRLREEAARRRRQRHRVRARRPGPGRGGARAAPVVHAAGLLALLAVVSAATAGPLTPGFGLIGILFALVVLNRVLAWRMLTASPAVQVPPLAPPAPPPDRAWLGAKQRFAQLRGAYAGYECDPMQVLRLPALADVTVPSTARFVDAFAEAQALDTDAFPGPGHAERFTTAVDGAERAWGAARDAAERIRLSTLSPGERACVERIIKLLTTARDSDSEPERLAAYTRARAELLKLDQTGVLHVPLPAQAALEEAARGQLPS